MTDQTTAELIAFTREEIEGLRRMGEHDWADALEGMMDALEAAERRAEEAERELQVAEDQANNLAGDLAQAEQERDSAMASYKDYMTLLRKAAELSAVVEKARAVIECESGWFRHRAGRVLDILAASPADALREHDARVWDEGFEAGWAEKEDPGAFVNDVWDAKTPNPYREEQGS